jgi:hypothetical protein
VLVVACGDNIQPGGPEIELTHSMLFTAEAGDTATFTAVLSMQPRANVVMSLSSSDTTEGTVTPAQVTFSVDNWDQPQVVTVTGVDDHLVDGPRAYKIMTAPATSDDARFQGLDAADPDVTNTDDDTAFISVTPTTGLVTTEAGGQATFSVVLSAEPTGSVTIDLSSSDVTEGSPSVSSLVFTSANWNNAQTVTVTGVDDVNVDGDITYTIITAPAMTTDTAFSGLNASDVELSNSDDDAPGITVTPLSGLVTTEAGGTATFSIVLDSQPTGDVTIDLSSGSPDEGLPDPIQVTFTNANWDTPQVITVTGADDFVDDDDQPYVILTSAAVSSDSNFNGVNPGDVAVTNTDDDIAGVTLTPLSGLETSENLGTATFTIVLDSQPIEDVTIALSSSDLTEGTISPTSVTFTADNWNAAQEITITGVDDPMVDGDVVYSIVTAVASSADVKYNGLDPADVSVTNIDNDVAGVTVSPLMVTTTESGTPPNAVFAVVLNAQPSADVTIPITSLDTTEGTTVESMLVFTPSNWNMPQSVTILPVNDGVNDGDITYTIAVGAATSTDTNYNGVDGDDVQVTNVDDDLPGFIIVPTGGLVVSEYRDSDEFTIQLTIQPTANVTVAVSSSDLTEGTVNTSSLTFTPANWNVPQVVTVTGVNDAQMDGHQTFFIVLAPAVSTDLGYNGIDPQDVDVLNFDDETPGVYVQVRALLKTFEQVTGQTTQARVRLTIAPTGDVTCTFSISDPSEGVIVEGATLTFTPMNYDKFQDVRIQGVDDAVDDGDVVYTLITNSCTSTDPVYNNYNPRNPRLVNVDNDP